MILNLFLCYFQKYKRFINLPWICELNSALKEVMIISTRLNTFSDFLYTVLMPQHDPCMPPALGLRLERQCSSSTVDRATKDCILSRRQRFAKPSKITEYTRRAMVTPKRLFVFSQITKVYGWRCNQIWIQNLLCYKFEDCGFLRSSVTHGRTNIDFLGFPTIHKKPLRGNNLSSLVVKTWILMAQEHWEGGVGTKRWGISTSLHKASKFWDLNFHVKKL